MAMIEEPYVYVFDASNPHQSILGLERNADAKIYPASTTKILTCIVALEYAYSAGHSLDDVITISEAATDWGQGNSLMGVFRGETFSLRDMLYGLMLVSGNDAAVAIAEHIAGSENEFAKLMNEKAAAIGMQNSRFLTVHGKHKSDHYSTARDMGILTAYALQNPDFCQIVSAAEHVATELGNDRPIRLVNSNRLIADVEPTDDNPNPISCLYESAIGVKTGDTNPAGKCLVAAAERGGVRLVAVLMGGTLFDSYYTNNQNNMKPPAKEKYNARRFQDAALLFDHVYSVLMETYTVEQLIERGLPVQFTVQIANASEQDEARGLLVVDAVYASGKNVQMMRSVREALEVDYAASANVVHYEEGQKAPINKGNIIGRVDYIAGGVVILTADLIATREVQEAVINNMATDEPGATPINIFDSPLPTPGADEPINVGRRLVIALIIIVGVFLLLLALLMVRRAIIMKRRREEAEQRRRRKQAEIKRREEMARRGYGYYQE